MIKPYVQINKKRNIVLWKKYNKKKVLGGR